MERRLYLSTKLTITTGCPYAVVLARRLPDMLWGRLFDEITPLPVPQGIGRELFLKVELSILPWFAVLLLSAHRPLVRECCGACERAPHVVAANLLSGFMGSEPSQRRLYVPTSMREEDGAFVVQAKVGLVATLSTSQQ
jgi:hypothetical protein